MKKIPLLLVLILVIGFSFTSCKEAKKVEVDPREEMIDAADTVENEVSEVEAVKSEEIAMVQYQCPEKCEEDTYREAGSCPVCKADLKEVAKEETDQ